MPLVMPRPQMPLLLRYTSAVSLFGLLFTPDSCRHYLARRSNSTGAKVGKPLCSKCYNATRKEWYHGVKLHAFVMLRPGKLPIPCAFQISQASLCDLWAAKQIDLDCAPVASGKLFADRAYADAAWKVALRDNRAIELITPRKKKPTDILSSGDCFNSSVASFRQPIESFFNWLQIKSAIQSASYRRIAIAYQTAGPTLCQGNENRPCSTRGGPPVPSTAHSHFNYKKCPRHSNLNGGAKESFNCRPGKGRLRFRPGCIPYRGRKRCRWCPWSRPFQPPNPPHGHRRHRRVHR